MTAAQREAARLRTRLNSGRRIHWRCANTLRIRIAELEGDTPTLEQVVVERSPRRPRGCPAGDPWCPCQDGDACNHQDGLGQLARWVLQGYGREEVAA